MANWSKKDYYQASESENDEEIAREKLKETADLLQESDLFPDFEHEELNYNQLTEDELLEVIERDSPELITVLGTIKQLANRVKTAKKNHDQVTLDYCKLLSAHLSFYLFLKAKGKIAANHPVLFSIKSLEKTIVDRTTHYKPLAAPEKLEKVHKEIEKIPLSGDAKKKREVSEKIQKNKGIVKKRKKLERNVRVKNKMKYLKKVKVRKTILGISERTQERYAGEKTGIRKNLVKSVKLT